MGTDIHMVVEVRDGAGWKRAKVDRPCENCHGSLKVTYHDGTIHPCWCADERGEGVPGRSGVFTSRSYDTFAILAAVRNGYGVAGCDTGDGFIPLAKPRGVPADFKPVGDYELGDHSFSWVTLAELLSYPHWEKITTKRGSVNIEQFAAWEKGGRGRPSDYCGGTMGASVYYVSNGTMRGLIADEVLVQAARHKKNAIDFKWKFPVETPNFNTMVDWQEQYRQCCKEFHDEFIPALCKLGAPENVRIVFGFDS